MIKRIIGIAAAILLLAYFITLILHVSAHDDQYLWDFRTHREAGKILAAGSNPVTLCSNLSDFILILLLDLM